MTEGEDVWRNALSVNAWVKTECSNPILKSNKSAWGGGALSNKEWNVCMINVHCNVFSAHYGDQNLQYYRSYLLLVKVICPVSFLI